MPLYSLSIHKSGDRRIIAFLESSDDKFVNAVPKLDKLQGPVRRTLLKRFDNWVDGHINKKQYHGWDKSKHSGKYTDCFTFKTQHDRVRIYGFKYNGQKSSGERVEICALVHLTHKFQKRTETSNLDKVLRVMGEENTQKLLQRRL